MILGLSRTARTELSMDFATLELEYFGTEACQIVLPVLREFEIRLREPEVDPTLEWAYSGGKLLISRYHWTNIEQELLDTQNWSQILKLEIQKPGLVNTICWKQVEPTPVVDDLVEIDVCAVGLNFKVQTNLPADLNKLTFSRMSLWPQASLKISTQSAEGSAMKAAVS